VFSAAAAAAAAAAVSLLALLLLMLLGDQWTCPTELYGIGKYAADAYYMFCR